MMCEDLGLSLRGACFVEIFDCSQSLFDFSRTGVASRGSTVSSTI